MMGSDIVQHFFFVNNILLITNISLTSSISPHAIPSHCHYYTSPLLLLHLTSHHFFSSSESWVYQKILGFFSHYNFSFHYVQCWYVLLQPTSHHLFSSSCSKSWVYQKIPGVLYHYNFPFHSVQCWSLGLRFIRI